MKKLICVHCGTYVDYEIRENEQVEIIKKAEVAYKEKVAYCRNCGKAVWSETLEMENALAPINSYCEIVGLISPMKIQKGLIRYNIKKRPLATLLGWSGVTIVRFIDGQLPSKMYSDKLKEIFDNPKIFLKLLEDNKKRISNVAYTKSKKAVEEILKKRTEKPMVDTERPKYQIATPFYVSSNKKSNRKVGAEWQNPIYYC